MSESVKVRCPACQTKLRMKGEVFGRKILCPQCGQKFRVNAPQRAAPAEELPSPVPSRSKRPAARPRPQASNDDFLDAISAGHPADEFGADDGLPLSDYQRSQIDRKKKVADASAGRSKKKKRRSSGSESAALGFITMIAAALVGGLVGSMLWAGIVYATGFQIGFMAVVVGALVGISVCIVRTDDGQLPGIIAAVVALLAIIGGKLAAAVLLANSYTDEVIYRDVKDNNVMIAHVAGKVAGEWTAEGRALQWPGMEADEMEAEADELADGEEGEVDFSGLHLDKEDYPSDVWTEAEKRWNAKTPAEQQTLRDAVVAEDQAGEEAAAAGKGFVVGLFFLFSFGLFELMWFFFAVSTAYRVALGISD